MISPANDWFVEAEKDGKRKRFPVLFFEYHEEVDELPRIPMVFRAWVWVNQIEQLVDALDTLPGGWEFSRMYQAEATQKMATYEVLEEWFRQRGPIDKFDLKAFRARAMKSKVGEILAEEALREMVSNEEA